MADTQTTAARPDMDILDDIQLWINDYPPLVNDRRHIHIQVTDGAVTVRGNVKTPITRSYVEHNISIISGVTSVDHGALYDDESIRLAVGPLLTQGTIANVEWGVVVLSGLLPNDAGLEALVGAISQVAGVKKVVAVG